MAVIHLFGHAAMDFDPSATIDAVNEAKARGTQVVAVSMLGHKADVAFMAIASDMRDLRTFQSAIQRAGIFITDSYVSLTEVSEYAANVPEEMKNARLYPQIPIAGKNAWCFYPMSKKREATDNWFTLPFDKRSELMMEHGKSGKGKEGEQKLLAAYRWCDAFDQPIA